MGFPSQKKKKSPPPLFFRLSFLFLSCVLCLPLHLFILAPLRSLITALSQLLISHKYFTQRVLLWEPPAQKWGVMNTKNRRLATATATAFFSFLFFSLFTSFVFAPLSFFIPSDLCALASVKPIRFVFHPLTLKPETVELFTGSSLGWHRCVSIRRTMMVQRSDS